MKKYETNKMNSFARTEEIMVRNESVWKDDPDVSGVFKSIQVKTREVNLHHQQQNKNGNISTALKTRLKSELVGLAVRISDSAVSYAVSQKNLALEMSVKLTKSSLNNLSQVSLYDMLTNFNKVVQPHKGSLKHLEESDFEKFSTLLAAFKEAMPKTGADTSETKTATINIGDTIKHVNELYNTLKKHLAPYKYTSPIFFSDFTNSRGVNDLKGKGKKKDDKGKQGQ